MADKSEITTIVENGKRKKPIRKIFLAIGIPVGALIVLFIVLVINSMVSNNKIIRAGDELFDKEEYVLAIEQYTIAVGENQSVKNSTALKKRGIAYAFVGDYDKALMDLSESLKIVSNDTETLRYRADVYEIIGDYANAISDFEKIVRLNPSNAAKWGIVGHIEELKVK